MEVVPAGVEETGGLERGRLGRRWQGGDGGEAQRSNG